MAWTGADRRISSTLLYAETRSALARARRDGRIATHDLALTRRFVERLWEDVDRVEVTEQISRQAGGLAEQHGLRAYDAVHLASAVSIADDGVVFVAADGDLLAAAARRGIKTAPLDA